ncbi:MAG: hypothetical protein KAU17_13395 [Spirochaetales bacterium]|nr:hypothetical protein [Spirochaetales bacterium]
MPREAQKADTFQKKLLKLLPSEAVATYLAVINIIPNKESSQIVLWIIIGVITLITPFYLVKFMDMSFKRKPLQIIFISISFIVWAFSINGEHWLPLPSDLLYLKTLILILWTFALPILITRKE